MFIQEVSIQVNSSVDPEEAFEEVDLLMSYFRSSGQKQGKIESQFIKNGNIVCYPYTLEANSLAPKYNNFYVNRQLRKVEEMCGAKFNFRTVGKTAESYQGPCQCQESDFFILFTHYVTIASPVICGNCDLSVPLYRLPPYYDHGYGPILQWESDYQACDTLQMNCMVGERWATNQLSQYTSQLSKVGIAICRRIEELTGKTTYYYLYNYRKVSGKEGAELKCPSCGQPWLLRERLHKFYDYKCDACKLLSTISPNT